MKQRHAREKLRIEIPPHLMHVVGHNAQALITKLGIIVKQMASLQFPKWKAIPNDDKKNMWIATKVTNVL